MPSELTDQQWAEIDKLIYARRSIEAIKLYRGHTGSDLKDSKDAIDARCAELEAKNPKLFAPRGGCMPMFLIFVSSIVFVLRSLA